MAPPLPLRRGGQGPCSPMASVRQWPHRRWCEHACCVSVTCASTRSEHGTPGPRRRQARSPAARLLSTPGCHPDERLSSRPREAGWNEAVRGPGVPRTAKGAVDLRTAPRTAEGAVELRDAPPVYWPHRLAGRAAWRRHCPSGEGARHRARQWRRFGNGLTAAPGLHVASALRPASSLPRPRSRPPSGAGLRSSRRRSEGRWSPTQRAPNA